MFYVRHASAIHVAFSHASKAFDRVNTHIRLTKLEQRHVPNYTLRLLRSEYINRRICTRRDV